MKLKEISKLLSTITTLALAASSSVMAKEISNYQDLLRVMKTGKPVHVLVDYSKCTVKQKNDSDFGLDVRTVGLTLDRLFEITETRSDGRRMNVIGYAHHNWGGSDSYILSRLLIHVWEDNTVDVIDDVVDPLTFKLKGRDWMMCKTTSDGSGGITFKA